MYIILDNARHCAPRPQHTPGSQCILGKLWEAHPNVPFLPDEAFAKYRAKPPSKAETKAERRAAQNKWAREKYHRNKEAKSAKQAQSRTAMRRARSDAEKKARLQASKRRYQASEKGKATARRYEARRRTERNRKARDRYWSDPAHREERQTKALRRYHEKKAA